MATLPQTSAPDLPAFIKRHPVTTYYVLAFAISWGGLLVAAGPGGMPGTSEQVSKLLPIALLTLFAGPSVAGILMTGLVYGRAGLRAYRSRLLKWQVGVHWYAVAILTCPILVTAILFALSFISPAFLPAIVTSDHKITLVLTGIAAGLGGLFEELGWTGFAVPGLRLRYSVLRTGLIVGFLWGAWHIPITFWSTGTASGAFSPQLFLPPLLFYVAVLPGYRVLMVWVYDRTRSLLVAIFMHMSLVPSTLFVLAPQATGTALMLYYVVLAVALWSIVAAVIVTSTRQRSRDENTRVIPLASEAKTAVRS